MLLPLLKRCPEVRLEYVIVGFILVMLVLIVGLSLLSGVIPGVDSVIKMLSGK